MSYEDKWKQKYSISRIQDEIAEEIKDELLKKCETDRQRNIVKETINKVKRNHRFDTMVTSENKHR
jgi:hypothetical protein